MCHCLLLAAIWVGYGPKKYLSQLEHSVLTYHLFRIFRPLGVSCSVKRLFVILAHLRSFSSSKFRSSCNWLDVLRVSIKHSAVQHTTGFISRVYNDLSRIQRIWSFDCKRSWCIEVFDSSYIERYLLFFNNLIVTLSRRI